MTIAITLLVLFLAWIVAELLGHGLPTMLKEFAYRIYRAGCVLEKMQARSAAEVNELWMRELEK